MADYSNLFRGGGVSSVNSPRNNKGKNRIFTFIALCCLVLLGIWVYGKINGETADKTKEKEIEIVDKTGNAENPQQETPTTTNTRKNNTHASKKNNLPPKASATAKAELAKANTALQKEEFVQAKKHVANVLQTGVKEGDLIWEQAVDILGKANTGIYMTNVPAPNKKMYTIQEGDSLIRIAKKFKTTVESIQKSNGLESSNQIIFPGKTLYIYTGDWAVKVDKSKFKLYLLDGKDIFKIYKIGIGRQGRTPSGTFIISTKEKEPVWYNDGRAIQYGSKENVLGTRWMALKPIGETNSNLSGYGIHGTWEPETIGTKSSNGCIRMKNEEVNELYSILPYRTEVTIVD